jgi:hypothetical protein
VLIPMGTVSSSPVFSASFIISTNFGVRHEDTVLSTIGRYNDVILSHSGFPLGRCDTSISVAKHLGQTNIQVA